MYFKRGVSLSFFVLLPDFYGNENNKKIIFCFLQKGVDKGKKKCYYNQVVNRRRNLEN